MKLSVHRAGLESLSTTSVFGTVLIPQLLFSYISALYMLFHPAIACFVQEGRYKAGVWSENPKEII